MSEEKEKKFCPFQAMTYCDSKCALWVYGYPSGSCAVVRLADNTEKLNDKLKEITNGNESVNCEVHAHVRY